MPPVKPRTPADPNPPPARRRSAPPPTPGTALLRALLEGGPASRSVLAATLDLSRPTITEVSRSLLELGVIREAEEAHARRRGKGRPTVNLELNGAYGHCVGAHVTGQQAHLVLTDLLGTTLGTLSVPSSDDVERLGAHLAEGVEQLRQRSGVPRQGLLGLGLAISGFVDPHSGVCLQSANLGWYDAPVADVVQRATGLTTTLENDAKAAAISEKLYGLARDSGNFTLVTLGESVGGAHFVNGELYRGTTGGAGELAHCTVDLGPHARPCRCGKRGCLDTLASGNALLERAQERGLTLTAAPELEQLALRGDPAAQDLLRQASIELGLVVSHVIQSQDPELILIADLLGFSGKLFLTQLRQAIENHILPRLLSSTRIEMHRVTEDFWARGAASVAAQRFFATVGQ